MVGVVEDKRIFEGGYGRGLLSQGRERTNGYPRRTWGEGYDI